MPAGLNAGSAWIKVAPDMRPFAAGTRAGAVKSGQEAGSRFSDGFKRRLKVGAAIGGALAVAGAGKLLKESVREASNLGESINAVEVTFGKASGGILKLGRDAANSVGLSRSEFNSLAVQFSAFAGEIAGKGGDVTGVMKDLTTRGADFASVMNLEVNEAMGLFQSGLAGETEPLRKYGIDLSAAAVESHAYAEGIADVGDKLTEQQKVQARYSLLMKQTSKTQGDFKNTSDSLANSQRILGANVDNLQAEVGSKLIPALERLSGWALNTGLPALKSLGGFLSRNKTTIVTLAAAVGIAAVTWGVYTAATKVAVAWTQRQVIVQKVLNKVMRLNPIGILITVLAALGAALVIAYRRSDTFRKIVNRAWASIRGAIKSAWTNVIKPALKAMWSFIRNVLAPIVQWLWAKIVRPTFNLMGRAIALWWRAARGVFGLLRAYFTGVLFPVIRFLWDKVIRPVFSGIGKTISATWTKVIRPVFNALRTVIADRVVPAFRRGVKSIGDIWDGLKSAARKPVEFVVDTVYNNGIRKVVNAIPGVPNLPSLSFARGGVLPGYTPGRDVHQFTSPTGGRLDLSGGEAIMRPEFVRAMGGERGIRALNDRARKGFAQGGVWHPGPRSTRAGHGKSLDQAWDINSPGGTGTPVRAFLDGIITTVGNTGGESYGQYIKMNHPAAGLQSLYAHLSAQLVRVGQSVARGQIIGREGNTGGSTGPHLHFELGGGASAISAAGSGSTSAAAAKEAEKQSFLSRFKGALSAAKDFATSIPRNLKALANMGGWGPMIGQMTKGLANDVGGYINKKIPNRFLPDNPIPQFDRGGWLKPGMMGVNRSGRPEPVFNERQWATLRAAVQPYMAGRIQAGDTYARTGGSQRPIHVTMPATATPEAAAAAAGARIASALAARGL